MLSEETHAQIEKRNQVFDNIAKDFTYTMGNLKARDETKQKGWTNLSLTYGEIEFKSFYQIFRWIQQTFKDTDPDCWHNAFNNPGGSFIDLGHGTGKGVLCGALMHQFEKSWGIELLESLQALSVEMKAVYDGYVQQVDE